MLTDAAVKAARPRRRAFKMWDQGGLYLFVGSKGLKSWRLRLRRQGAEMVRTLGRYPSMSLNEARSCADQEHAQLERGDKPSPPRAPAAASFEAIARSWHAKHLADWTGIHAADVLASLERDVFPAIGAVPCDRITAPDVRELLEVVEARGRIETARRLRQRIEAIFAFGKAHGAGADNPARDIGAALAAAPLRHQQPALTSVQEVRALLAAVDAGPGRAIVKLASRFLALTAVRMAALRGARWEEIEDLDGPVPVWRVPATRVKLRVAKKASAAHDHLVPLAPAAVEVLRAARALAGHIPGAGELVFAGAGGPLSHGAIGVLYQRAGYAGRHVPHGWRASFSTIMNEAAPADRALVEQVLGHVLKRDDGREAKVEAAYNRAQHLAPRGALLERWARILTD